MIRRIFLTITVFMLFAPLLLAASAKEEVMSDPVKKGMLEIVEKENGRSVVKAIFCLGREGVTDEKFIDLLKIKVNSDIPEVRAASLYAMRMSKQKKLLPVIMKKLADPYWQARIEAYLALPVLGSPAGIQLALIKGLTDKDMAVQMAVLDALKQSALEESKGSILKYCESHESPVHMAKAIDVIAERKIPVDKKFLSLKLKSKNPVVIRAAIKCVAALNMAGLYNNVSTLVAVDPAFIRREALKCLVKLNAVKSENVLIKMSGDNDNSVREEAARNAALFSSENVISGLFKLHGDEYRNVRRAASMSLVKIAEAGNQNKEAVLAKIQGAVNNSRLECRLEGYYLIGKLKAKNILLSLKDKFTTLADIRERRLVVWAVAECEAKEFSPEILGLISDKDLPLRYQAAIAVGKLKYAEAVPVIVKLVSEVQSEPMSGEKMYVYVEPARKKLLESLGAIGTEEALRAVIDKTGFTEVPESEESYDVLFDIIIRNKLKDAEGNLTRLYKSKYTSDNVKYRAVKTLEKITGKSSGLKLPQLKERHGRYFLERYE